MAKSGIYSIVSRIDSKVYIGQSVDISSRVCHHFMHLRRNMHANQHLQAAFNLYGRNNFYYKILEECSIDELIAKEVFYIYKFNSTNDVFGYNIRLENGPKTRHAESTIKRQRLNCATVPKPVYGFNRSGTFIKSWGSISHCAKELGVSPCDVKRTISQHQVTCKGIILNDENVFRMREKKFSKNHLNFIQKISPNKVYNGIS